MQVLHLRKINHFMPISSVNLSASVIIGGRQSFTGEIYSITLGGHTRSDLFCPYIKGFTRRRVGESRQEDDFPSIKMFRYLCRIHETRLREGHHRGIKCTLLKAGHGENRPSEPCINSIDDPDWSPAHEAVSANNVDSNSRSTMRGPAAP